MSFEIECCWHCDPAGDTARIVLLLWILGHMGAAALIVSGRIPRATIGYGVVFATSRTVGVVSTLLFALLSLLWLRSDHF